MKKLIIGAASLMLCAGLQAQDFKINPSGYFENHGANVMVFSDVYPEGHQGGVTLVLNGDRRAAGGDVRFEISQGQWQGLPKMRKRVVDEAANEIRVTLSYPDSAKHMAGFNPMLYPDFAFGYTIKVKGEKDYLVLTVDLDRPVPERFAGKLGFNLELVPSTLLGKPWIMDNRTGVFPHQAMGPTMKQTSNMEHIGDFNPKGKASLDQLLLDRKTYNPMIADDIVSAPLAAGKKFVLNPQDELAKITIESEKGDLMLYDGRINHNNGWFVLRSEFPGRNERECGEMDYPSHSYQGVALCTGGTGLSSGLSSRTEESGCHRIGQTGYGFPATCPLPYCSRWQETGEAAGCQGLGRFPALPLFAVRLYGNYGRGTLSGDVR